MNADGIIGADENSKTYNLYLYTCNNCINSIDAQGTFALTLTQGLFIIGGLILGAAVMQTPAFKSATLKAIDAITNLPSISKSKEEAKFKDKSKENKKKSTQFIDMGVQILEI